MGFIDFVILSITGAIFLINILLLIIGLKSTNDEVRRRQYKKLYVPIITMCVIVLVLYVTVVSIGNIVL